MDEQQQQQYKQIESQKEDNCKRNPKFICFLYLLGSLSLVSIWLGLYWIPYLKETNSLVSTKETILNWREEEDIQKKKNCPWLIYQCDDALVTQSFSCGFPVAPMCYLPSRCVKRGNTTECHRRMDWYENLDDTFYKPTNDDFCRIFHPSDCPCLGDDCSCQTEPCSPAYLGKACDEWFERARNETCRHIDVEIGYNVSSFSSSTSSSFAVITRRQTVCCPITQLSCIKRETAKIKNSFRSGWYHHDNPEQDLIPEYPSLGGGGWLVLASFFGTFAFCHAVWFKLNS